MKTLYTLSLIAVTIDISFGSDICNIVTEILNTTSGFGTNKALDFKKLAAEYGYQAEEYAVTTEDGYILGLFHIPGKQGLPVFLMHGFVDCSDTWLGRGKGSLGIALAVKNYDVWFGNVRGNKYSRRHVTLNPDIDAAFWDFSFHEHGLYDLPALIDKVLSLTGSEKLNAFGHSMGNTIFYILGSLRPEYNTKVNVMTALAPICFFRHLHSILIPIFQISPLVNRILERIGMNELLGNSLTGKIMQLVCGDPTDGYALCAMGLMFPISGFDPEELEPDFYYKAVQNYPQASSRRTFNHFSQLYLRGKFAQYDYGTERNLKEYNSTEPPDYDLTQVTMPVVLLTALNDQLAVLGDVDTLNTKLPNVVDYIIDERALMNHMDFTWGAHAKYYLFPYLFNILDEYN